MHVIVDRDSELPAQWSALEGTTIRRAGQPAPLDLDPAPSGLVLVIADASAIDLAQLTSLIEQAKAAVAGGKAAVFVPGVETTPVLASRGALYAFDAQQTHYAGGFDPTYGALAMGLDMQFRLSSRAIPAVRIGSPAITKPVVAELGIYLDVMTKNLSPRSLASRFAPLFTGIVAHGLRSENTTILDLQRSPGGDDVLTMSVNPDGLAGARTVRDWSLRLEASKEAHYINRVARRIPSGALPHIDAFMDEVWEATGIPADQRKVLEDSFADLTPVRHSALLVAPSEDETALARATAIAQTVPNTVLWDPNARIVSTWDGEWVPSGYGIDDLSNEAVVYLIGSSIRTVPWAHTSGAVVVSDLTTTEVTPRLAQDWVGHTDEFRGPSAQNFGETFLRADRILTSDAAGRDFVLGFISGLNRLNAYAYDADTSYATIVAVEEGTSGAEAIIARPLRALDLIETTVEYESTPHAVFAKEKTGFVDSFKHSGRKAMTAVKGLKK